MLSEFRNEPFVDWNDPANVKAMRDALAQVRGQFGKTYPLLIGGREIFDGTKIASINPAKPDEVIGYVVQADAEQAAEAVAEADRAFQSWQYVPAERRAQYLFDAAEILRQRRFELNAWLVYEVSKSWPEADADVAELIDFLDYYARQMLDLAGPQPVTPLPGERNDLRYIGLGVGLVISPWNFPAAIMGGMTTAAIVAGNTVVLKPASTSMVIAAIFSQILVRDLGLPAGVLNFVPGPGSKIGDLLVDHPRTRFIAFTGSKEVGLRIFERASKTQPDQIWLKRTVLEMGGKDAILVDETADLDAAAAGIVTSAWGFQGQKCSACSRAIVVEEVYDAVLQKVIEGTKKLSMGDTSEQGVFMGAVIDKAAYGTIREYIEVGEKEGRLVLGGDVPDGDGYFIPPTIIADVAPDARIAQEEIFGPVLAFIKARDFEDGLRIANDTEFGLTGSLYSQDRERMDRASREFHVGNFYLNRKCTGALVGVHPFGGFNMSGTDSKAGGPDYLLLFTQAKTISEKI